MKMAPVCEIEMDLENVRRDELLVVAQKHWRLPALAWEEEIASFLDFEASTQ